MTEHPLILHTRVVAGSGGGPDRTILNSPRFLAEHGYDALCVYFRPPDDPGFAALEERAAAWGAPMVAIDDRGALDLSVLRRVDRLCRERRPVIWHGHDYKSNLFGLLLRRRHRLRLVTTVHGWVNFTWKTPLFYAVDRSSLKRYERVVCVSRGELDQCLRAGVGPERCSIIHNAVDVERFRPPANGEGRASGDRQRLVVGAVGRLAPEKGFDLLLEACAALLRSGVDLELQISGEGELRSELERRGAELGFGDRLRLRGFVGEIERFHRGLDLFVLSSRREGLPQALLEAMASGTACVATRLPGIPEQLVDDHNLRLVEPGSAPELERGIRSLSGDGAARERLGVTARATIEDHFSFAARMTKMVQLYDRLLNREGAA